MKLLVTIQPTIKKGKEIVKDLKAIKELEKYYKEINGESAYFYEFEGHKTFGFVIDVPKPVMSRGFKVQLMLFYDTITLCRNNH